MYMIPFNETGNHPLRVFSKATNVTMIYIYIYIYDLIQSESAHGLFIIKSLNGILTNLAEKSVFSDRARP